MIPTQPVRPRRCTLAVPGSSEKMMTKAAALTVDQVMLDLEDAVAVDAKVSARASVIDALKFLSCHDDIIQVVTQAGERLDTIILTKSKSPGDVAFVHLLLDQLEGKLGLNKRIGIECLIEEVEGLIRVEKIAASSDRIETLIFGVGDYAASQHMPLASVGSTADYPPDLWHYPRFKLTMASRANGVAPMDGPFADFQDMRSLELEAGRAHTLGMAGKWAIHPAQVDPIQAMFTPSAERIADARKQKAAYEIAQTNGQGAINVDGVMVDAASIRLSQSLLEQADLLGL